MSIKNRIYSIPYLIDSLDFAGVIDIIDEQNPEGWKLSAGGWSPVYLNMRELPKHPDLFKSVVDILSDLILLYIKQTFGTLNKFFVKEIVLVGVPTMGASIAPAVAYKIGCSFAIIRQRFTENTKQPIEGDIENKKIILIDDVLTTGNAIQWVIKKIFDYDWEAQFISAFVIADRRATQNELSFDTRCRDDLANIPVKIDVHSLFTLEDVAKYHFYLRPWERTALLGYVKNPGRFSCPEDYFNYTKNRRKQ